MKKTQEKLYKDSKRNKKRKGIMGKIETNYKRTLEIDRKLERDRRHLIKQV